MAYPGPITDTERAMTKDDVIAEINRRIAELRKAKKTIAHGERIDELRVFKKWVEQQ